MDIGYKTRLQNSLGLPVSGARKPREPGGGLGEDLGDWEKARRRLEEASKKTGKTETPRRRETLSLLSRKSEAIDSVRDSDVTPPPSSRDSLAPFGLSTCPVEFRHR